LVTKLQARTKDLHAAIREAEGMHDSMEKCAAFLTSTGADAMAAARTVSDQLEVTVGDEYWPLPRYREMLFPV
jgi:glutamine synthetase